jgi:DNA-binding NarL/FixJ family response regulator
MSTNPTDVGHPDVVHLLDLLSRGVPTMDIATKTGRTPREVRQQVREVRDVLGATTDIHAVVLALRRGLI